MSGNSAGTAPSATVQATGTIAAEGAVSSAETKDGEEETESGDKYHVTPVPSTEQFVEPRKVVPVAELLDYIRSTFDDEDVLDSLPVEAAGNPGAWHAWKAHRRGGSGPGHLKRGSPQARLPGDWHWDGIWARRVQDEIETSNSDPMLYGNAARGSGDELVSFT